MSRKKQGEFGDFQTPDALAQQVAQFIKQIFPTPSVVVEPTCGVGSFLSASLQQFGTHAVYYGFEINETYISIVQETLEAHQNVFIEQTDFFHKDWQTFFEEKHDKKMLVIGNPPWVTNAELGQLESLNLPDKNNFQRYKGFDALTGKSNFDISEWILIHLLGWIPQQDAVLAMLCKTSVARKVLQHAWKNNFRISESAIYVIDTKRHFNVSVEGCLFVCHMGEPHNTTSCPVYQGLSQHEKIATIGLHDSEILPDLLTYNKWAHLNGGEYYTWRSGVKHDCAKVMELTCIEGKFKNGLGETWELEDTFLYPLFKSSDVVKNKVSSPTRWIIMTQKKVNDETNIIQKQAPKTWNYLLYHASQLDKRKSSIYKGKPRFSIFGVGEYTFASWKVAISGLYKTIHFTVIPPFKQKPGIVDDTCYLIPCNTQAEAHFLADLLNSDIAKEFLNSLIFWDAKRPVTVNVLRRLNVLALADELGKGEELRMFLAHKRKTNHNQQIPLFEPVPAAVFERV